MIKLTADERDLLERIGDKEELRPFFFRKAKGLKWFDSLAERGYFKPEQNPRPLPSKEEGYVNVPFWPATEYLVATSSELLSEDNKAYAEKFIEVIRTVTKHAIDHGFSNYRTWWQFSKVVRNVPPIFIQGEDVALFDYWFNDPYERNLVAEEIGEKWLVALLESGDEHCKKLAEKLLDIIYRLEFRKLERGLGTRKEAVLRFGAWNARTITKKIASKAGRGLGLNAVRIFQHRLENILAELDNDIWSSIWRSAVEDHEQNHSGDDAGDIILEGYRDSLLAYVKEAPLTANKYVEQLLGSPFETTKRIAIYAIDQRYQELSQLVGRVIVDQHFTSNLQHELWHFLHNHYPQFSPNEKVLVQEAITRLAGDDESDQQDDGPKTYERARWLSAIKNYGDDVAEQYQQCVGIVGGDPDHPDFSSYRTSGWVNHKSAITKEELLSWDSDELIRQLSAYLDSYAPSPTVDGPDLEGLTKTLRQVVKAEPLRFYTQLPKFSILGLPYIHEFIRAYGELWVEKAHLPWDEIWQYLLAFCQDVIKREVFWFPGNVQQGKAFVANRHWIVGEIGRLIENGTRSDEHAFSEKYLAQAEAILLILLEKEKGEEFKPDSDAVSIAINSPRGRCIEALINLTLRSCRLAGNHVETWTHFQSIYDAELARADVGEYEFATLVANYLPNFLYMSKEWVLANLENIFDQDNYQKWLCAMDGYAYVGTVHEGIYTHLKDRGHFIRALDDEHIKKRVHEKIIQNIAVAYIHNFEDLELESSLVHQLLVRRRPEELGQLIWFIWSQRKDAGENIRSKVFELWPRLLKVIDTSTREGRQLASKLCDWTVFVDVVDEKNKELILAIAPFAGEEYNSHELIESIAKISVRQPSEAYEIWLRFLEGTSSDFPEEGIRAALANLVRVGPEGLRMAKNIVSTYLKEGNERPNQWLREITESAQNG